MTINNALVSGRFGISNTQAPSENPRAYRVDMDFSIDPTVNIDLTTQIDNNLITNFQGMFVDNVDNTDPITFIFSGTNQRIVVGAGVAEYVPILTLNPPVIIAVSNGGIKVSAFFYNVPIDPFIDATQAPATPASQTEIITATNDIIVPSWATRISGYLLGGGGGGGGGFAGAGGGSGGGGASGAATYFNDIPVTPGATLHVDIGASGAGGAVGVNGTDGGNTSLTGANQVIPPGWFGGRGTHGAAVNGGLGGTSVGPGLIGSTGGSAGTATASGGLPTVPTNNYPTSVAGSGGGGGAGNGAASAGGPSYSFIVPYIVNGGGLNGGGAGGSNIVGDGAIGGAIGNPGNDATTPGAGGGGGSSNNAGGNGASGLAQITFLP